MCVPASTVFGTITGVSSIINGFSDNNSSYRAQIAINNAKSAEQEALRQKQLGINEARKEKILGMQNVQKQIAKNASSGFDINSETVINNYEDILNQANTNAFLTQENYDLKSKTYFDKANEYISDANQILKQNNQKQGLKFLSGTAQVSSKWF